jgi:hypothetical protein
MIGMETLPRFDQIQYFVDFFGSIYDAKILTLNDREWRPDYWLAFLMVGVHTCIYYTCIHHTYIYTSIITASIIPASIIPTSIHLS